MNWPNHDDLMQYAWVHGEEHRNIFSSAIGFDMVKLRVEVDSINWEVFDDLYDKRYKRKRIKGLPDTKLIQYMKATIAEEDILPIDGNKRYKSIIINYVDKKPHFSFKLLPPNILKANSNLPENYYISQLIVYVDPVEEWLGNLNNQRCLELKNRVSSIIDYLKSYGVFLNPQKATINYFELNRNYCLVGTGARFFLRYFEAAFQNLSGENSRFTIQPKKEPWGCLGTADYTGIFANSSTVEIHVYDKLGQIETKRKKTVGIGDHKDELNPKTIYRVEFVVKKPKQVKSWLSVTNVFDLQDDMIEDAYNLYLEKYVLGKFREQMNRLYSAMVLHDITTNDKHWQNVFCRDLIYLCEELAIDKGFITYELIREMLKEIPSNTVQNNLSRYNKSIEKKIQLNLKYDAQKTIETFLRADAEDFEVVFYVLPKCDINNKTPKMSKNTNCKENMKKKIIDLLKEGKKEKEICKQLGISRATYFRLKK